MKIFLGGPIQSMAADPSLRLKMETAVRVLVNRLLKQGFDVFNAHLVERFGKTTHEWQPHSIAERDFDWMTRCHAFVALLPSTHEGVLARSDGTHVEIGWASALGKPIVLLVDQNVYSQCSQLVQGLHVMSAVYPLALGDVLEEPDQLVDLLTRCAQPSAARNVQGL